MERINWIDTAKGYGIICVIIGHMATPGMTAWIYSFHIPLFFFLSGYLFNSNYTLNVFLRHKFKSLFIPYFFLIIPLVFNELFSYLDFGWGWRDLYEEMVNVIIQKRYTPLWFVASLFCSNILFYIVNKLIDNYFWKSFVLILFPIVAIVFWDNGGLSLPWNLDVSFFIMPFMLVANYIQKSKLNDIVISNNNYILLLFFIGNIIFGGWNYYLAGKKMDLYFNEVSVVLLTYLSAFLGILFLINISCFKTNRIISYIGRNSLLIFAWHLMIYNWLGRLYDYLGVFQPPLPLYLILTRDAVSLIMILLVLIPINELILRSKFKFVLGRG